MNSRDDERIQRLRRLANNFFSDKVVVEFRNRGSGIEIIVRFGFMGAIGYVFDGEELDNNFEEYAQSVFGQCVLALSHQVFIRSKQ